MNLTEMKAGLLALPWSRLGVPGREAINRDDLLRLVAVAEAAMERNCHHDANCPSSWGDDDCKCGKRDLDAALAGVTR